MFISAVGRSCILHAKPIAAFRRRYLEPEHINGKSAYTVTFNSDDLVKKSVAALDEKLHVPAVEFVVTTGELESADVTKESLASGAAMKTTARILGILGARPQKRC